MRYLHNLFCSLSQVLNVLVFNGEPNESLSGRAHRQGWSKSVAAINALFFWQKDHCGEAFRKDVDWAREFSKGRR